MRSLSRSFWNTWGRYVRDDPLWLGWNVGALVSILLPLFITTVARIVAGGDDEEEDQNNNNNQDYYYYNNQNNNNNHWWNRWYNNNNNNNNNYNQDDEERSRDAVPWWWFWGEEGGASRDAARQSTLVLMTYLWSLGLFVGLVVYGNYVFRKQLWATTSHSPSGSSGAVQQQQQQQAASVSLGMLQGALIMFWNLALVTVLLICGLGDAIQMDGPEVEENGGWYGQWGVCVFFTNFFWLLWGLVFSYLLKQRHGTSYDMSSEHNKQDDSGASYYMRQDDGDHKSAATTTVEKKHMEII